MNCKCSMSCDLVAPAITTVTGGPKNHQRDKIAFIDPHWATYQNSSNNQHINICIFCSETFDLLHDELALVLGEYVHLPLVDDFMDIEITFIEFGLKN